MVKTTVTTEPEPGLPDISPLDSRFVAFVGRLGGFNRREAQTLVRQQGGTPVDVNDPRMDLVIIGAEELSLNSDQLLGELLDDALIAKASRGELDVIHETQLLQRLGLVDELPQVQHYTPSMLAELLGVPTATIRRWHRKGLIMPVREVHRLPYFDFQEVLTARRLAQLLAAGASAAKIEAKLTQLAQLFPDIDRPLAQLSVIVEGREILLRDGEGLVDSGGQRRFDFEAASTSEQTSGNHAANLTDDQPDVEPVCTVALPQVEAVPTAESLFEQAATLEAEGALDDAIDTYRSAILAGAGTADVHFLLAELLYRVGDTTAARERYYVALEIDDDFVEARANLGCVLAETGQHHLAIAAFEGALSRHPEYPDVLFHLARTLDDVGRPEQALDRWREFLSLAPDSPWAAEARDRLGITT